MNKTLSARNKADVLPEILQRDKEFKCFYGGCDLSEEYIFEHLDDNRTHNHITNLVLSCRSCNNRKPFDPGMRLAAQYKLHRNKKYHLTRASISERVEVRAPTLNTVIDINQQNFEITHQYLEEVVQTDGFFDFKEAVPTCAMVCRNKTGNGSDSAVRRYLKELTSRVGPFMIVSDDNKNKIIVKRTGQ